MRTLEDIQTSELSNLKTCILPGTRHLFLSNNLFLQNEIRDDRLVEWFFELAESVQVKI